MDINLQNYRDLHLEADCCAALSDPTRISILHTLHRKPLNVTELTNELEVPQPTTSRHLKVLRERGLVHTRRQGTAIIYHLTDDRVIHALDLIHAVMREHVARHANLVTENA